MLNRTLLLAAAAVLLAGCMPAPVAPGGSGAVACTLEAKLCPDGSYVGRTGPNCEFAPCPGSSTGSPLARVSDGTVALSYDDADFGLAVTPEQVLAGSYIPPCEPGFAYCLYYKGEAYDGTNFDGAGLGITKRADLGADCLTAAPDGYEGLTPATHSGDGYATSLFDGLGDAGAGHYAKDQVYRLQAGSACYELRTRIGASQYANYEPGIIREFTAADEAILAAKLRGHVGRVTLADGKPLIFPSSGSGAAL